MKQVLAQLEKDNTKLFPSLLRAMRPLMADDGMDSRKMGRVNKQTVRELCFIRLRPA